MKRERVCTKISSLQQAVPGLNQLTEYQYEEQVITEISKIVEKYKGEQEYVCGLENTINLFENTKLKQIVVQRVNEVLKENGHNGIVLKERTNFRNGSKENRVIGGITINTKKILFLTNNFFLRSSCFPWTIPLASKV